MRETFDIRIDTPKTFKRGVVDLVGTDGVLEAKLSVGELDDVVLRGSYEDKEFVLDVDLDDVPGIGAVSGRMTGSTWGNSIDAVGELNIGKVEVCGTSISTAAGDVHGRPGSMYAGRWSDGF